jgi:Spy/CpxP family protein refolding chaperone
MKNFVIKAIGAAGFAAAMGLSGFAQQTPQTAPLAQTEQTAPGHPGKHRGQHEDGLQNVLSDLNLTDAQKQQISAIRAKYNTPEAQAQRQELRSLRQQQRQGAQLTADQQARLQTLQQQAETSRQQQFKEILAVLTPEQRDQLQAKVKNSRGRHKAPGAPETNQ